MHYPLKRLATYKYRWLALGVIALGLAIVIIDNTILNISIPYMLRDLKASLSSIEWVISGYSLTIAALLITIGRLGDLFGRKLLFVTGILIFAVGSFIGSIAGSASVLILGRAVIQAVGAAMTLTSALALVAANFQGKERAVAFGIWGAVAGAAASIGPLLGGYLTTYFSWRWSLRINIIVAGLALLGSVFIAESKGEGERRFDWLGTLLSGAGLFTLVFGFVEGQAYGWFRPTGTFSIFGWQWPFANVSVTPFFFLLSAVILILFVFNEIRLEKKGGSPILRMSIFKSPGFSMGLATLGILALGQFGTFFILPIFLENVLGYNALQAGLTFLSASLAMFVFGSMSGYLANRFEIKWIVVGGMIFLSAGAFALIHSIALGASDLSLTPALILFGMGFGLGSSQMNNIIISSAPLKLAGEASAASITVRQIGSSIGVAIIGAVLATTLASNIMTGVKTDASIPPQAKTGIAEDLANINIESGSFGNIGSNIPTGIQDAVDHDVKTALVASSRSALRVGWYFILAGSLLSLFLPKMGRKDVLKDKPLDE